MSDFLEPARVEGMQFYCDPPLPPVDISPETGMVAGEGEGNSATGQRGYVSRRKYAGLMVEWFFARVIWKRT